MNSVSKFSSNPFNGRNRRMRGALFAAAAGLTVLLSGCSSPGPEGEFYDPYETQNRAIHKFNKGVDRALVDPASNAYDTVVPKPVRTIAINFTDNLSMPNRLINNLLQLDIEAAVVNSVRFVSNTVLGFGGIFDVASEFGISDDHTDFGETLHVWQVGEGAYFELPFFGPSTGRDAVGLVADIVLLDPMGYFLPSDTSDERAAIWTLDKLGKRYEYSDVIEDLLYNSPDSYVTLRSFHLQNRRFELDRELTEADLEDPYAQ